MAPRLLLALALWAACRGRQAAPGQPRVQCRAPRYPLAVDCSWTLPPAPNRTGAVSFIATYRLGLGAQESRPCLQPTPSAARCAIPGLQLFSMAPLLLNVTALHPWGPCSSFLAFVVERVVQPDPPQAVRVQALPGRRLQVRWAPPASWPFPELFTLKYRLRLGRPGAARARQVGPIEATSFTFRAGRPQARYWVQVAAQDLLDHGRPSEWSLPAVSP